MAGHSKWANIKHKKAANDAKRGKMWSKLARAIIMAAKNGGGDPATNLPLRYAIDDAKAENMPKQTIENAIKKGSGELGAEHYDAVTYEGYGPNGVAVMVEVLTDNRNRTVPELKKIFERCGGNLGTSGCVSYLFSPKGMINVAKAKASEDRIMEVALEAGAEDVTDEGEYWQVVTEQADYPAVRQAIQDAKIEIQSAELTMIPSTTVRCTGKHAEQILTLMEMMEDHDDVQKVHANFDIADEEMATLSG